MRRLKPTEIKAVAEILEAPADDTHELARAILRKVNEMRDREQLWVAAVRAQSGESQIFGPYLTLNEAQRAEALVRVGYGNSEVRVGYWRLSGRDVEE